MGIPRQFIVFTACLCVGSVTMATSQTTSQTTSQCASQWEQPLQTSEHKQALVIAKQNLPTQIDADYAWFNAEQKAVLEGNVQISQGDQRISADNIEYNVITGDVEASKHIVLSTADQHIQAEQMRYNLNTQSGEIHQAQFSDQITSAKGQAEQITRIDQDISHIKNAVFSTCADTTSAWAIHSGLLQLNQKTGRGTSRNTVFKVKDTPVFYLPYFNFPVDNRRSTGFLTPSVGLQGQDNFKVSTPLYVNIHPQLDLTLTPSVFVKRNPLIESELRYMVSPKHQGRLQGGFSGSDNTYNNQNRKQMLWAHRSEFSDHLNGDILWQYVSDKDYWYDLANSPLSSESVFQERHATLNYQREQLSAQLQVQKFQTLDRTLSDSEKPYSRLPQLLVDYTHSRRWQQQNFLLSNSSDIAFFSKPIADNSATNDSGLRVYQNLGLSMPLIKREGGVVPSIQLRGLGYRLLNDGTKSLNDDVVFAPLINIDSFANFEKTNNGRRQTIVPRAMYTYAPFKNQSTLPTYDTIELNYNYDRLFSPTRFIGHDRLDDQNTFSLGLQYKAYDNNDKQTLGFAIGEQYYQSAPRVTTSSSQTLTDKRSGIAFASSWNMVAGLQLQLDHSWTPDGDNNYSYASLLLQPQDRMPYISDYIHSVEIGYLERNQTNTSNNNQVVRASLVSKRVNNWALVGYSQYDVIVNRFRDQLIGVDYRSCCWRMGLYSRRVYADIEDIRNEKPNGQIFLELSLKGIAGLSSRVSSLLKNKIPEYEGIPP